MDRASGCAKKTISSFRFWSSSGFVSLRITVQATGCTALPNKITVVQLKLEVKWIKGVFDIKLGKSGNFLGVQNVLKGLNNEISENRSEREWNKIYCKTNCLFNSVKWHLYTSVAKCGNIVGLQATSSSKPAYRYRIPGSTGVPMKRQENKRVEKRSLEICHSCVVAWRYETIIQKLNYKR
jgi:hypothetical protein